MAIDPKTGKEQEALTPAQLVEHEEKEREAGAALARGEEPSKPKEESEPKPEKKEEPAPVALPKEDPPATPVVPEVKQEPAPAPQETPANILKALADTKVWGTNLSMRVKELEHALTEAKAGRATEAQVEKAKSAAQQAEKDMFASQDQVKKLAEDYPGLDKVLEPLLKDISELRGLKDDIKGVRDQMAQTQTQNAQREKVNEFKTFFETKVMPEVEKVHADFKEIIRPGSNYFAWADAQSPAMRMAAVASNDPRDIVMAVSEYKKFVGSGDAKAMNTEQQKKQQAARAGAATLRGAGSPRPPGFDAPGSADNPSAQEEYEAGRKLAESAGK